jgi:hypothetical protein
VLLCADSAMRYTLKARKQSVVSQEETRSLGASLKWTVVEMDARATSAVAIRFAAMAQIAECALPGEIEVDAKIPEQPSKATSAAHAVTGTLGKLGIGAGEPEDGTPQVVEAFPNDFLGEIGRLATPVLAKGIEAANIPVFQDELDIGFLVKVKLSDLALHHVDMSHPLVVCAEDGDPELVPYAATFSQTLSFRGTFASGASDTKWSYARVKTESAKTSAKMAAAGVLFGTSLPSVEGNGSGQLHAKAISVHVLVGVTYPPIPKGGFFNRHPKPPAPRVDVIRAEMTSVKFSHEISGSSALSMAMRVQKKAIEKHIGAAVSESFGASVSKFCTSELLSALSDRQIRLNAN